MRPPCISIRSGSTAATPAQLALVGAVGAPIVDDATGDQILFTYIEGAGDLDPGHGRCSS